jgi:hypothetical protein
MRGCVLFALLVVCSSSFAGNEQQFPSPGPKRAQSAPLADPPTQGCPIPSRTIPYPSVLLLEDTKPFAYAKLNLLEQVGGVVSDGPEVVYREVKQSLTVMELRPREEERLMTSTTFCWETVTDPHTGHCQTVCHQVPVVKKVKVTVFDRVPVVKEVVVRVPTFKPGKDAEIRLFQVASSTEAALLKRCHVIFTPNEAVVPTPTCPSSAPLPAQTQPSTAGQPQEPRAAVEQPDQLPPPRPYP